MGTVYRKKNHLYVGYRDDSGDWKYAATGLPVGQERKARKLLEKLEARVAAGREIAGTPAGPITVSHYVQRWIADRRRLGLADVSNDESRLRIHVLPVLGSLELAQVRPRHLTNLFQGLRARRKLAPKSIYNIYSTLKAVFRDAMLADLIDASPCVLTKYQLGENEDKNPEWRATAIYSRDELELLISDPRVEEDRQVMYALQGLAGLRHGEAAGLRWKHYDATIRPLGRFMIATSYDTGRTKTKRPRLVPVHPTLASMLAAWHVRGWREIMGRAPQDEDLLIPLPKSARFEAGTMRSKNDSYKRLQADLKTLGLRSRRGHDLRRTMISLARTDGARKDLLELCTHNPRKRGSTIDVYTEFPWEALCAEIAKLRVSRREGEVIPTPANAPKAATKNSIISSELTTHLLPSTTEPNNSRSLNGGGAGSRTVLVD